MKNTLMLFTAAIILITGCASMQSAEKNDSDISYALESGNFSDTGAISIIDRDYRFTVILVNNLEWALESQQIADYGLPYITKFKRGEKLTPFLTFGTFANGTFDLTYHVRLHGPDGKFVEENNDLLRDLLITRSTVNEGMTYQAQEFVTVNFDETYALGVYKLYIVIKDCGHNRKACVMQFELAAE